MRWHPKWRWSDNPDGSGAVTQWRHAFAWLPTFVDGEWLWLEPYHKRYLAWGWDFVDVQRRLPAQAMSAREGQDRNGLEGDSPASAVAEGHAPNLQVDTGD